MQKVLFQRIEVILLFFSITELLAISKREHFLLLEEEAAGWTNEPLVSMDVKSHSISSYQAGTVFFPPCNLRVYCVIKIIKGEDYMMVPQRRGRHLDREIFNTTG